jgi:hypothetical protein
MSTRESPDNALLLEFRNWLHLTAPSSTLRTCTDPAGLVLEFLEAKGLTGFEAYLGSVQALKDERLYESLIEECAALGARTKPLKEGSRRIDALERYRKVPLHAVFLYTTEDHLVAEYIQQNWGALDSLSGDLCDIHPSVNQFHAREDAYDFIDRLDVVQRSGFSLYSSLPGLFFWDLNSGSEYVPFGQDASCAAIITVVRTIFEEVRKESNLDSVRRAKRRLTSTKQEAEWNAEEKTTLARLILPTCPGIEHVLNQLRNSLEGGLFKLTADELAEGLYAELALRKFTYEYEPYSPRNAQRVRLAEQLLSGIRPSAATCLDLALLFAAGVEAGHGHPLIFHLIHNFGHVAHAMTGYWVAAGSHDRVLLDARLVQAKIQSGEIAVVETTGLCADAEKRLSFAEAKRKARDLLAEPDWSFGFVLDIAAARARELLPR